MAESSEILLAIHERHANAIMAKRKTHELRKRIPTLAEGALVYLYQTAPRSAVIGRFVVRSVHRKPPCEAWSDVGTDGFCISEPEFTAYVGTATEVTALEVDDPVWLCRPATVSELRDIDAGFHPPQSASYLRSEAIRKYLEDLLPQRHLADRGRSGRPSRRRSRATA